MIEKRTLARPYAKALFLLAQEKERYQHWLQILTSLAAIASDATMYHLLRDAALPASRLLGLFEELCPLALGEEGKHFLQLLATRKRLFILPEIAALYREYCDKVAQILPVTFVSVIPLSTAQKQAFTILLSEHFGKRVELENQIDPALMGGFCIKAGDIVIDSSLRGRLTQLKEIMGK